ncbi:MAG TPA: hypothetical protein PLS90_04000 [Candidatus Sumerlaeota bacterium]|nr:hypothetical protein [Candidatus Sumerlaeota bacterium]HOR27066.1 hypothetical protein [Candidatus Sumerlaeota bacterium]HPK01599.1 hypothetical protein [Candidatus Sumerlaeota bacterium]
MRKALWLMLAACGLAMGCSRLPIPTEQITFYRSDALNEGRPCAVDVVYPKDEDQLYQITREIGPAGWFRSDLYRTAYKDKEWLDEKSTTLMLSNKDEQDRFMVIIAEFTNPDPNPPRGQEPILVFREDMKPRPRKHEYIWVHDGSLQRLDGRPKDLRGREDHEDDRRARDRDRRD